MLVLLAIAHAGLPLSNIGDYRVVDDPLFVQPIEDLNGDGADELLVYDWLYLGSPDGLEYQPTLVFNVSRAFVVDLHRSDCATDGLLFDRQGRVHGACLRADGFHRWAELPDGEGYWATAAAPTGDLDGDGLSDFAVVDVVPDEDMGRIRTFAGDPVEFGRLLSTTYFEATRSLRYAWGDFDGDKRTDLAISSWSWLSEEGDVRVFLATATGYPQDEDVFLDGVGHWATTMPNLDGELRDGLVVFDASGEMQLLPGTPDGIATEPVLSSFENARPPAAGPDVNGDGYPDLVLHDADGLVVYLGEGDGQFSRSAYSTPPLAVYSPWTRMSAHWADFNGDGCDDVVYSGTAAWYEVDNMLILEGCPDREVHTGNRPASDPDPDPDVATVAVERDCGCSDSRSHLPGSAAWMAPVLLAFRRRRAIEQISG